jgi:hypothetical protein
MFSTELATLRAQITFARTNISVQAGGVGVHPDRPRDRASYSHARSPNVIARSPDGAGETFQNDTESSRSDVKAARLEPDTVRVRNPQTVIVEVDVGDEVFAVPSIRTEPVGKAVEGSDWHMSSL